MEVQYSLFIWPNKKISVFRVTGLNILGRVGTHIFYKKNLKKKQKHNFMHFERHFAFKMHKVIFFLRKPKTNLGFTSTFR